MDEGDIPLTGLVGVNGCGNDTDGVIRLLGTVLASLLAPPLLLMWLCCCIVSLAVVVFVLFLTSWLLDEDDTVKPDFQSGLTKEKSRNSS